MINNQGIPSSELQINFGVLQIDSENSATGFRATNGVNEERGGRGDTILY